MQRRKTARIPTVSTSPVGGSLPPDPESQSELVRQIARYHSAMFCADDCLRRCRDACNLEDLAHCNFLYADRQLMLATEYVEKARVALELAKRRIVEVPVAEPCQAVVVLFDKFGKTGPYGGDRL